MEIFNRNMLKDYKIFEMIMVFIIPMEKRKPKFALINAFNVLFSLILIDFNSLFLLIHINTLVEIYFYFLIFVSFTFLKPF